MKFLFIVNPVAGLRDGLTTVLPMIEKRFCDSGLDWSAVVTEYPLNASEIARSAAQSGEHIRVCACGGDGTLCEVINGVFGFDNIEVASYPCGSGNDFIKCYGDAEAFRDLDAVIDGEAVPVDAIKVNDGVCFNLLSVGIDADVNASTQHWRQYPLFRGKISYDIALAECLLKPLGKRMSVTVDGELHENTYMLAAAGNGKVYGGGYMATPEARPDDGIIDVITVKKLPLTRIMSVLGKYKRGEHISSGEVTPELRDCVDYYKAKTLSIEADAEFVLNVDGESQRVTSVATSMLPHSWRFVLPPSIAKAQK